MGDKSKEFPGWDEAALQKHVAAFLALDSDKASEYFEAHLFGPLSSLLAFVHRRLSLTLPVGELEDFKQRLLAHLSQNLHQYKPERGELFSWVYATAKNRGLNMAREKKSRPQTSPIETLSEDIASHYLQAAPWATYSNFQDSEGKREFFVRFWTTERLAEHFRAGSVQFKVAAYVVKLVAERRAMTQKEIATAAGIKRQSLTHVFERLTKATAESYGNLN